MKNEFQLTLMLFVLFATKIHIFISKPIKFQPTPNNLLLNRNVLHSKSRENEKIPLQFMN